LQAVSCWRRHDGYRPTLTSQGLWQPEKLPYKLLVLSPTWISIIWGIRFETADAPFLLDGAFALLVAVTLLLPLLEYAAPAAVPREVVVRGFLWGGIGDQMADVETVPHEEIIAAILAAGLAPLILVGIKDPHTRMPSMREASPQEMIKLHREVLTELRKPQTP
jgi:hypothetical protein